MEPLGQTAPCSGQVVLLWGQGQLGVLQDVGGKGMLSQSRIFALGDFRRLCSPSFPSLGTSMPISFQYLSFFSG